MFSRFEKQLKKLEETLDPLLETTKVVKDGLITMQTPLKNFKLGKYKLVKDAPTAEMPYDKAVEKGYIGTATLENIKEFQDIGFVFDKVIFKGTILPDDLTPPKWWNTSQLGQWRPRRPKPVIWNKVGTIVLGKDPKGGPVAYVRSSGMDAPKLYTPTEYSNVAVAYRKYVTGTTQVPPEELSGQLRPSMTVTRVAKDPTVEDILKDAVKSTRKKKWTIHPDGTIDIHGGFKLSNKFTLNAVRKIDFRGIFPIKLGVVEGDFNAFDFNDLTGAPKVIKGNLVVTAQDVASGTGPVVNITGLKDTIVEGEEVYFNLNGSVLDTASIPAAKKISLHRATIKADAFKDLRLLQPGKLVLSNCIIENFNGLPDPFQGELEITEYSARQRLSLEGLPKRIEGDLDLTSYNSDSSVNPQLRSETFPDFITGDLKLIMKDVTEKDLLKMYIGDRVGGTITAMVDNQRVALDKALFTKAYIDALTQHTSTHGVNLADL